MIKYILKCENNHEFESWFSNSDEFEKLNKKKLLDCIYCSSKKINKSIMAPMISSSKKDEQVGIVNKNLKDEKNKLLQLRRYIENNFDYVGKDFSKKVREVYYDKKQKSYLWYHHTRRKRRTSRRRNRFTFSSLG